MASAWACARLPVNRLDVLGESLGRFLALSYARHKDGMTLAARGKPGMAGGQCQEAWRCCQSMRPVATEQIERVK